MGRAELEEGGQNEGEGLGPGEDTGMVAAIADESYTLSRITETGEILVLTK